MEIGSKSFGGRALDVVKLADRRQERQAGCDRGGGAVALLAKRLRDTAGERRTGSERERRGSKVS